MENEQPFFSVCRSLICRRGLCVLTVMILLAASLSLYWLCFYDNYHCVIDDELYRSAQLNIEELRGYIEKDGLVTVINLRAETNTGWWAEEKMLCEDQGVAHFDVPFRGDELPTMEKMAKLVDVFDTCERPLLIHCWYGADRTSLAVALYLLVHGNQRVDPTSAFSVKYGHLPLIFRHVKCFDEAFTRYEQSVLARPRSGDTR